MSRSAPVPPAAIVLDVDGTLLTPQHRVAPATRTAIARARAAGVRVMLASARGPGGLRLIVRELGLDGPQIASCGALVCDLGPGGAGPGAVRFERRIHHPRARRIVAAAAACGVEVGWFAGERWLAPRAGQALRRVAAITGETLLPLSGAEREDPHKLLCVAPGPHETAALAELRRRLPADVQSACSHPDYLEVTAAGADKGAALAHACAALGLDLRAVVAIGDGENDVPMLRLAGTGVAMGHAPAAVRAAADWVTDANDADGVARAIERVLAGVTAPASAPLAA